MIFALCGLRTLNCNRNPNTEHVLSRSCTHRQTTQSHYWSSSVTVTLAETLEGAETKVPGQTLQLGAERLQQRLWSLSLFLSLPLFLWVSLSLSNSSCCSITLDSKFNYSTFLLPLWGNNPNMYFTYRLARTHTHTNNDHIGETFCLFGPSINAQRFNKRINCATLELV